MASITFMVSGAPVAAAPRLGPSVLGVVVGRRGRLRAGLALRGRRGAALARAKVQIDEQSASKYERDQVQHLIPNPHGPMRQGPEQNVGQGKHKSIVTPKTWCVPY